LTTRRSLPPGGAARPLIRLALLALLGGVLAACRAPVPPAAPHLQPVAFERLAGWEADEGAADALSAFRRSCARLERREAEAGMGKFEAAGRVADWLPACQAAAEVPAGDAARAFFEAWFQPYAVLVGDEAQGLFTGYYEPLLQGALEPDGRHRWPLYERPHDLIAVDLGQFATDLEGRRIAGRVKEGRLVPYPDRAAIDDGALADRGLELLWVDDPVALFFLQIQGSGQVALPGGRRVRVGYAAQNGHPYRAIGRDLVEMGALEKDEVSLQTIRDWLHAHPDQAAGLMQKNPSYVFFRDLGPVEGELGPPGAQGVPLTPGRSLAVDRSFIGYGTPNWLETTVPLPEEERPFRRLLVAQDTGGAITGPIRGDVFWGAGDLAEHVAGHMRQPGRWYLLLPKGVAPVS
jgi:membrane-bound lytic murein transglycosylase A